MREIIECVALFAWFPRAALLAGIAKITTSQACNEWINLVN